MTCSFGLTPCPLVVLPSRTVLLSGRPKANIMDFAPITNIASFAMCSAPLNPEVIAATAAAAGVPTPAPCIPAIVSPWIPGYPQVLVQGMPALTSDSRTMCMWLGQISFTNDGQIPLPPPMCMAPPGKPNMSIPLRMPLTDADFSGGGGGGGGDLKQQYNSDIAKAKDAGKAEEMMSKSLEKASKDYSEAGNTAKAEQLAKQAEAARNTAADKSNEAMGDVNQCYRETMPMSSSQMEQFTPEQQASYNQMREDIAAKKEQEYEKADKEYESKENPTLTDSATHDLQQHYADKQEQSSLQQLTSFFTQSASTGHFSTPDIDNDDIASFADAASTGQFSKPNIDNDDIASFADAASTGQSSKPDINNDDIVCFAESASTGQVSKPNEELHTESEQVAKQEVEIEIHKPIYKYVHGKEKFKNPPTWIVVHYTACPDDGAEQMCKSMSRNKDASTHFLIDEKDIYAAVPLEYPAFHVKSGKVEQPNPDKEMSLKELANYKKRDWRYNLAASNHLRWQSEGDDFKGNYYSIGVDFCVKKIDKNNKKSTATDWYFEDEAVENVAKTVAYLANEYNIKLGHIIRHGDATGKLCPQPYTYPFEEGDRKWAKFKEKVADYMNRGVIAKWI